MESGRLYAAALVDGAQVHMDKCIRPNLGDRLTKNGNGLDTNLEVSIRRASLGLAREQCTLAKEPTATWSSRSDSVSPNNGSSYLELFRITR
jgi:hypothetical protein